MPTLHPAGDFRAEILDHGFSETQSGTPQFVVKFRTEHDTINGYFAMTDRAIEHTIKKIRAMGYEGDDLSDLEDGALLRGLFCSIQVTHDTYNGQVSAKVGWVNPDGYTPGVKKSAAAAANAKRFNSLLKKIPAGTPAKEGDAPPF